MSNVHTIQNIDTKGYRLGSSREAELEEALRNKIGYMSELASGYENLQKSYLEYSNRIEDKHKRREKQFDRERKAWKDSLNQSNRDIDKLRTSAINLVNEVKRLRAEVNDLTIQLSHERISSTDYKSKHDFQLNDMKKLHSETKCLERKLASKQKESLSKESTITTLKGELDQIKNDLSINVIELERLRLGGAEENIQANDDKEKICLSDYLKRK